MPDFSFFIWMALSLASVQVLPLQPVSSVHPAGKLPLLEEILDRFYGEVGGIEATSLRGFQRGSHLIRRVPN